MLEDDGQRFEDFMNESQNQAHDAMRKAEDATKNKMERVMEQGLCWMEVAKISIRCDFV